MRRIIGMLTKDNLHCRANDSNDSIIMTGGAIVGGPLHHNTL